jgi:hypothetical protein
MGDLEKMQPRPFKRTFFELLHPLSQEPPEKQTDAASRRLLLDEFSRHGEIYPNDTGADHQTGAPAHHSDEFPAGYSLAGCSPASPASASPAERDSATGFGQLWTLMRRDK